MAISERTYGLTSSGYVVPTFAQVRARNVERFITALKARGVDVTGVKTDALSINGMLIDFATQLQIEAHDDAAQLLAQLDGDSADGIYLENVMSLRAGLLRYAEAKSTATFDFVTDAAVTVPAGTVVRLDSDPTVTMVTLAEAEATGAETLTISCEAVTAGSDTTAADSSSWSIVNTFTGWESVTAITNNAITPGRLRETDNELRARMLRDDLSSGLGTDGAIRRKVIEALPSDGMCTVTSNRSDATDGDGRTAHSFEVLVWSASAISDDGVASAIWEAQCGARTSYGVDKTATVTASNDQDTTVNWSEASEVIVDVRLSSVTTVGAPADWQTQIKTAVRAVINALAGAADVTHFPLLQAVAAFTWLTGATVEFRTGAASYATTAVSIGTRQKAVNRDGSGDVTFV